MRALPLAVLLAGLASHAAAQCDDAEEFPLADVAAVLAASLADGPTEGLSTNPRIREVQERLHGSSGFGAQYSTSALLDAAFQDGAFTMSDAAAFVELRTRILDAWSDARRVEDFFWGLDGEQPVSPWEVDARYMEDLRLIVAELGADMEPAAREHLQHILDIAGSSSMPEEVLDELHTYLDSRPSVPDAAEQFDDRLSDARATWAFDLYRGPNGFWRQAYKVAEAPDAEMRAFAERADAAGNKDGKVDLEEMSTTSLLVRMEKTFGVNVDLFITDEGRNFARVKDGRFEIHLDRRTPAHDLEGVLAHEYGHVLLARYDKSKDRSRRDREAEADYGSGWIHGKLGFALDHTGFGWMSRRWKYSADDPEHGDFRVRVETIGVGYRDASGKDLFATPEPEPSPEPGGGGAAFDPPI